MSTSDQRTKAVLTNADTLLTQVEHLSELIGHLQVEGRVQSDMAEAVGKLLQTARSLRTQLHLIASNQ
jgi:hypothetical protein